MILELVRRHGIEPKKVSSTHGGEYQSACPGCGGQDRYVNGKFEPTNRFHIWPEQNEGDGSYWCRQCGKGGDCIQFLMDFEGLNFPEACERLGRDLPDSRDLSTPRAAGPRPREAREYELPPEKWQEKAWKFVRWSYEKLFEHEEALAYLRNRGIREETAAACGLGWNPGGEGGDLYRDRESWGLRYLLNEKGRRRPLWLPMGLVVPWFWGTLPVRIRIRRYGELAFGPRYYVVAGSCGSTMVLKAPAKAYVIIESELDGCLVAQEAGDLLGVVALGSSAAKPDRAAMELLKEAAHVMVALDFDGPGAKACHWWKKNFPDCIRWPVPKGKDPGEACQQGLDIREWIKAGLPQALR